MPQTNAVWLSYLAFNGMCAVLTVYMLAHLTGNIGRRTELGYFRALLVSFVAYCLFDAVPPLVAPGLVPAGLGRFCLMVAIVLTVSMAYLWVRYFWAHIEPTRVPTRRMRVLAAIPLVVSLVPLVLPQASANFATIADGRVAQGPLYSLLGMPSALYLGYVGVRSAAMASRETVQARRTQELVMLQFAVMPLVGALVDALIPGTPVVTAAAFPSLSLIFLDMQRARVYTDALTGLNNRQRLYEYLDGRRGEAGRGLVLCLADVNRFKEINDSAGHLVGDQVLMAVSRALAGVAARCGGFLARWGGDEFVLLLDAPPEGGREALQREVDEALAQAMREDGLSVPVSISLGVTDCTEGDLEAAFERADGLMYEQKRLAHERMDHAGGRGERR